MSQLVPEYPFRHWHSPDTSQKPPSSAAKIRSAITYWCKKCCYYCQLTVKIEGYWNCNNNITWRCMQLTASQPWNTVCTVACHILEARQADHALQVVAAKMTTGIIAGDTRALTIRSTEWLSAMYRYPKSKIDNSKVSHVSLHLCNAVNCLCDVGYNDIDKPTREGVSDGNKQLHFLDQGGRECTWNVLLGYNEIPWS